MAMYLLLGLYALVLARSMALLLSQEISMLKTGAQLFFKTTQLNCFLSCKFMDLLTNTLVGLLLVFIGIKIYVNFKNTRHKACLAKIPGPKTFPLLGNSLEIKATTDLIPRFSEYIEKFGDIIQVWFGPLTVRIVVTNHSLIETLLSSTENINKSEDYIFLNNWLGEGLLTSKPTRWRKHRKILTPAFHFQILEKFVEVFEGPTTILIKRLKKVVGLKSVDIYPFISLNSLDIICETSMGTKVNAQENDDSDYVNAVQETTRIFIARVISPAKQFDFLYRFSKDYYKEKAALAILHGYTDSVIKQRKNELLDMQENSGHIEQNLYDRKKLTFLDILLMSKVDGEPISDKEIREEVDTFMFAGHDTTASAVSFTLYCLANNPEAQQKAFDEQKNLFGDVKDPKIKLYDLQNMTYLDLVIKESLRLYPSGPLVARSTVKDMEVDGKIYPKGLSFTIFVYGIHRDPKYFENPNTFDPMRFANMDSKYPFAYIPFSAGPRNCIGQRFAMIEAKFVLSSILRHFKLGPASPKEEPLLATELVLASKNGIKISLQERQ